MKNIRSGLIALLVLICCPVFAQKYTQTQVEDFVREVYADQAETLVFKNPSNRYDVLKDFLNRIEITNKPEFSGKKFRLLSTVALLEKYNPGLKRDAFDADHFNPLQYQFPYFSKSKEVFRVDGTDWLIVIQPVK